MVLRPKQKKCLFPVTRPTLENGRDPRLFLKLKNNRKTLYSYRVLPFCVKKRCFDQIWHIYEENLVFPPHYAQKEYVGNKQKTTTNNIRPTYPKLFGHVTGKN